MPVFVAWQGFSFYADRFDTDDLACRAVFGGGMLAIIALAGLIDDVATAGAPPASRSPSRAPLADAVAVRPGLVRVARRRPLIRLYGGGYSVGVAIWLLSLLRSTPRPGTSSGASP